MFEKIKKILKKLFYFNIFLYFYCFNDTFNSQQRYCFDRRQHKQKRTRTFTKTVFLMPPQNNILLRRLAQPRRVSLPNGRTFLA